MKTLMILSLLMLGLSAQAAEFTISVNKAGTVTTTSLHSCPAGSLEANGQLVSRTTYARLYSVMQDQYGAGDGTLTFQIPDYRGHFLRADDEAGAHSVGSTPRQVGTFQDQSTAKNGLYIIDPGHRHAALTNHGNGGSFGYSGQPMQQINGSALFYGIAPWGPASVTGVDIGGQAETRPYNIAVKYCISY